MKSPSRHHHLLLCLVLAGLLAGCGHGGAPASQGPPQVVDLSGHWEKDYQLSDNFENKYNLFLHDLRRPAQPSSGARGSLEGVGLSVTAPGASRDAVLGLARLAQEITRMPVLDISQQDGRVVIDREADFALRCAWFREHMVRSDNAFGSEVCGWKGEQLIFEIRMEGGLTLLHQLTLGPDRQQLNLTTTVASESVGTALTISNYYQRFTPRDSRYDCTQTLTRDKVCTRRREAR